MKKGKRVTYQTDSGGWVGTFDIDGKYLLVEWNRNHVNVKWATDICGLSKRDVNELVEKFRDESNTDI